ncbi:MAG: aminotransferase class I/II-fold pyridoxal phosphate-dependent enzyme [Micromonosporaceae bacterium]|nr:aminotransferase class I/II-fold pyridoxal phosphate-dependent enzyme [Micromonosporaceae bacterium]
MVHISATLAANEMIRARLARGERIQHLAFGEAGLPVHPELAAVLCGATGRGGYPSVAGDLAARQAVAGYFTRRGVAADPGQVLLAPGSKALLYALLSTLPGDVVLPTPSWVSYAAQSALAGKRTVRVPTPAEAGGVPDPALLKLTLEREAASGRRPGVLVLTVPDNPTGTVAGEALLREVCALAEEHQLVVVADQIYADLTHDGMPPVNPAGILPAGTVTTTGLSKNLALGGWRIGAALLPDSRLGARLRESLLHFGSEVWSALPGPMQDVVAYAFAEPPELASHIAASRRLHGAVARAMHGVFVDAGAECRPPQGAFYLYPDFTSVVAKPDSEALATTLLDQHGVAVLAGSAFGEDASRLTFRAATSLLYGDDDERRWAALRSDDPTGLPWIAGALTRLRDALAALHATPTGQGGEPGGGPKRETARSIADSTPSTAAEKV